jgi:hypothetical protein
MKIVNSILSTNNRSKPWVDLLVVQLKALHTRYINTQQQKHQTRTQERNIRKISPHTRTKWQTSSKNK